MLYFLSWIKNVNYSEITSLCFSWVSVQFSRSVVSDSLWPHELQHAKPPCPSPTSRVHSDSCPLSRWCHPAISSSIVLFSSCPQSLPASESFPMSQLFAWGGQSTGVSALASVLPKKSQGWVYGVYGVYEFLSIWSHYLPQAGIKITGRNINNLRYADDATLMVESGKEVKSLLMRVKEDSEKAGLKFNIPKIKIMASGPITLWQIDGGKVETVTDFIFLGFKITVDSDCSHEMKRCLLLGSKVMINIDSVLKSRDTMLPTKVYIVKAMILPVVLYGRESWTIKKVEHQKTDAFELQCWWRLKSPLDSEEIQLVNPKGNQPWIFIERTDAEAEAPILWTTEQRADSLKRTLMLGKIEARRRRGATGWDGWRASPTQWRWVWANSGW